MTDALLLEISILVARLTRHTRDVSDDIAAQIAGDLLQALPDLDGNPHETAKSVISRRASRHWLSAADEMRLLGAAAKWLDDRESDEADDERHDREQEDTGWWEPI
jgi:hypothetical protein